MSKEKNGVFKFLKGEFLFEEAAFKSWRMLAFIIFLMMLMVRSGHAVDEKVLKIAKLSKQEQELRAEYIALRSKAMQLKLESNVVAKVSEMGLKPSNTRVQVIKKIEKQE